MHPVFWWLLMLELKLELGLELAIWDVRVAVHR